MPFRTRTLLDIVNEISQSYIQSISMWEGLFFSFRPEIHIFFILFSLGSPADEKLRKYLEKKIKLKKAAGKMPSFDVVDLKKFPTSLNTFVVGKMYSRYRRGCCFLSTFFSPSVSRNVCINRQRPSLFGCCCCCCWRPCPLVLFLSDFCLWAI